MITPSTCQDGYANSPVHTTDTRIAHLMAGCVGPSDIAYITFDQPIKDSYIHLVFKSIAHAWRLLTIDFGCGRSKFRIAGRVCNGGVWATGNGYKSSTCEVLGPMLIRDAGCICLWTHKHSSLSVHHSTTRCTANINRASLGRPKSG